MSKIIRVTLFSIALLCSSVAASIAETSHWMPAKDVKAYIQKLNKQGSVPTKLNCGRDLNRSRAGVMHIKVQVTHVKKPGVNWYWAISTNIRKKDRELKAKGYKVVSRSGATSLNGGFVVKCVIWHK